MERCIYYNKKRKKWKIVVTILVLTSLLAVLSFFTYVNLRVRPLVESISNEQIKALTTSAINEATLEILTENPSYSDMVEISYDTNGDIQLIKVKSAVVNSLSQKTTLLSQKKIASLGMKGVDVPLGTLSGFMFLAGKGPTVSLQVIPVGSITSNFVSEFNSAGINQTNHKIYLRINSDVNVIIPGAYSTVKTLTEVVVLDSIIIGKIPDTYLNSNSLQDMLDLIP